MSKLNVGDLVATYLTNSSEYESLLQWGVVIEVNETLEDIYVVDQFGSGRWWPSTRWRLLKKRVDTSTQL
jgi:hypothetical protein